METIKFSQYDDEGETIEYSLPAKFEVCPTCQGRGAHCQRLGVFTSEEFDDLGDEFQESYFAGLYDERCEECNGDRVILVPDEERADPATLAEWERVRQEEAEYRHLVAMERRMGA